MEIDGRMTMKKSRSNCLTTLATHLRRYEKPREKGYDVFATTYISGDIPWRRILPEEVDPDTVEPVPFSPKFKIEAFSRQEEEKILRGKSVRKKEIIGSSQQIFEDYKEAEVSGEDKLGYLYFKAMQYSEVNKALALDEKYPKPDGNSLRLAFSKEHQRAIAAAREKMKRKEVEGAPLQQSENLFAIPTLSFSKSENGHGMATPGQLENLEKFREIIKEAEEALGKPPSFQDFQPKVEPWQFKAKEDRPRPKPTKRKKLPWKRNVYPPKSREERIAELRLRAPPLQSEYLETDHLPGLWLPELMVDTFKTACMEEQENDGDRQTGADDWWKRFSTTKKCLEWLKCIPESM